MKLHLMRFAKELKLSTESERERVGREAYEEDCRRCPFYIFGTDPEM
jgi:hypothetical protein